MFGEEVPVLFLDGRKAFKYRVTEGELRRKIARILVWEKFRGGTGEE